MNRKLWTARRLVPLGALALVAGAAGAQAAGSGGPAEPRRSVPAAAIVEPAPSAFVQIDPRTGAPLPMAIPKSVLRMGSPGVAARCRPGKTKPAPRPAPSQALLAAFGTLRRERTDDDALPARALAALKQAGLAPVDPRSARLLRANGDARAWVVPVPDVNVASPFACVRVGPVQEGLAVVSVNAAPAGGGGALRDLQRGVAAPAVDPCAGSARNMLGVSGIVPDGVEAVFVTAADGTATRADVRDNAYAFVLPHLRRPEARYVVWTGADGAPHVQPLPFVFSRVVGDVACRLVDTAPRVTPDVSMECGPLNGILTQISARAMALDAVRGRVPRARRAVPSAAARRAAARTRTRLRRVTPVPVPSVMGMPCAGAATSILSTSRPLVLSPPASRPPVPRAAAPVPRAAQAPRAVAPRAAPPRAAPPRSAPAPTVTVPAKPRMP